MDTVNKKDEKFYEDNERKDTMEEDGPLRATNKIQHELCPLGIGEFNGKACEGKPKEGKDTNKVKNPVSQFETDIGLSGIFNMNQSLRYENSFPQLSLLLPIGFPPPQKSVPPVKNEDTQKEYEHEDLRPKEERISLTIAQIRMGDVFCKVDIDPLMAL